MLELILIAVIAFSSGFILGFFVRKFFYKKIRQIVNNPDELPFRADSHVHDWHIEGKEHGLIVYYCTNGTCDEKIRSRTLLKRKEDA